jgi:uncharacterized protein (UPF0305 family)
MDERTKNIIEELDRFVPQKDKHQIIEARASNIIASAINLVTLINETFDSEISEELNKRLVNAIKNKDPQKFNRKIREYRKLEENRRLNVYK